MLGEKGLGPGDVCNVCARAYLNALKVRAELSDKLRADLQAGDGVDWSGEKLGDLGADACFVSSDWLHAWQRGGGVLASPTALISCPHDNLALKAQAAAVSADMWSRLLQVLGAETVLQGRPPLSSYASFPATAPLGELVCGQCRAEAVAKKQLAEARIKERQALELKALLDDVLPGLEVGKTYFLIPRCV